MARKYLFYLVRWQLSTPILALVLIWLSDMSTLLATVIANLIGGLLFFWVDRFIFRSVAKEPMWVIKNDVCCVDCGVQGTGYRIVEWMGYNRKNDKTPQFRCAACKDKKLTDVARRAVK